VSVAEAATTDAVVAALRAVRDPELDEDLVSLRFVAAVELAADGAVEVRLRLPTYWCAPNFAFLMAADARAAVLAVPGVASARVVLEDHFASDEIGGGLARGEGFDAAFPGESTGELGELRDLFTRKAFTARQSRLCDALLRAGRTFEELADVRLGALNGAADVGRCIELRERLGIDASPGSPAFVRADGSALDAEELSRFMRVARLVRLSLEGNAGLCRSLLATRYGIPDREETTAA
jgi:metal-sulfur cluster biosynthetic enzyme